MSIKRLRILIRYLSVLPTSNQNILTTQFQHVRARLRFERRVDQNRGSAFAETARPCLALAYPDGTAKSFGQRDKEFLSRAGFSGAFTQIQGYNAADADRFALKRFNVPGGSADFLTFVATVTGVREFARRIGL